MNCLLRGIRKFQTGKWISVCIKYPVRSYTLRGRDRREKGGLMTGFLIAVLSGILMSVQGVFNTGVTKNSSVWSANVFVQFTALCVCLAAWGVSDRTNLLAVWKTEPKYMLLGGVMGAAITWTVIKSMEALGPARAVLFIVIAQLAAAYAIELFGLFQTEGQPFSWRRMLGLFIAIAGIAIFQWK